MQKVARNNIKNKQPGKRKLPLILAWLFLFAFLSSCSASGQPAKTKPSIPTGSSVETQEPTNAPQDPASSEVTQDPNGSPRSDAEKRPDEQAETLLKSLSLEEKIGQMFFIASRRDETGHVRLGLDNELKKTMEKYKPGGFIFFADNLETIAQTRAFIDSLQKTSTIPLFLGIDEEGGLVSRLNKAPLFHSTIMPSPYDIGRTNNKTYAYEASYAISQEIKNLGFNLNFAPVADIFSNPKNTVIGKRAYAGNAELAALMVGEAVRGMQDGRIISVIKHFPGHGDTEQDSHTGAAVVERSLDELRATEFLPFKAGLEAGAGMVMTAHVLTPRITDNRLPATLSEPIISLIRTELGFDGVIITDGLEMGAISAFYPEEEAVVLAVEAGVDMLLIPSNLDRAYTSILNAVAEGRLTETRIDESVKRILTLKYEWLIGAPASNLDPEKILGSEEHRALAEKIRKDSSP